MKVPKAGRPLAKCPHPKGTCSCQKTYAFMVRIPKGMRLEYLFNMDPQLTVSPGSTCLCRPLYKVPAEPDDSNQSTSGSMPAVSSPSPAKVQKSGRRQSTIHAAPENIAKALESMPVDVKLEDSVASYLANLPSHHSEQNGQNGNSPSIDSNQTWSAASASNGLSQNTQSTQGSSCCSQKPPPVPPPVAPATGGSCCSGKTTPAVPNILSSAKEPTASQSQWNDMSFMNFSAPQNSWQSPMASSQGSFMQPYGMHDGQMQSFYMNNYTPDVSSTSYSNLMNGLGITQPNLSPYTTSTPQNSTHTPTPGGDICHDCKCGDECQCLGCAAHPFNNTTRQHVQEMGVMMTFDPDEHTPEAIANTYQSPPSFRGSTAPTPLNFFMQQSPSMDHGAHQNSFDPYTDPSSTMPSGFSSPLPTGPAFKQPLMHQSEYYTLEYPVGIPSACSDITGSCQCGNDCSCVGCLTHSGHNGVALEAPIPEPTMPNTTTTEHTSSHRGPPTSTAGSQTSRIPVLDNMSVPCLSPRTLETSMI